MGIVFGKTGVAEPAYDLLLSSTSNAAGQVPYQIRRYSSRFAIETEYSVNGDGNDSAGFRALAGYIGVGGKPQNDGGQAVSMTAPVVTSDVGKKIAMTAPVVTNADTKKSKKMQFILPAEFDDLSKIPKPTNPNVTILELKPETGAVYTFSGSVNDRIAKEKLSKLVASLKKDIGTTSDLDESKAEENYLLWQFHPPFTIPFLRKNEIWLELSEQQVDAILKKYKESKKESS
jgi:hypothetical protein